MLLRAAIRRSGSLLVPSWSRGPLGDAKPGLLGLSPGTSLPSRLQSSWREAR